MASPHIKSKRSLSMGPGTLEVPLELFALNRSRLSARLRELNVGNAIVVLQGGSELPFYDTDTTYHVFRQESYFMWTFGTLEPDCFGAVIVQTGESILFIPRLPPDYAVWSGPIHSLDFFKEKYGVTDVKYTDEIAAVLQSYNPDVLLTLSGVNYYSGLTSQDAQFDGIENFNVDKEILYTNIEELRVVKTDFELAVMQYVIDISSAAHREVMRMAKAGKTEYQCENAFLSYCYDVGGCRFVSYTCICGSGPNSAILHYGHAGAPNDRVIQPGDLCNFDMGSNYFGYAADITCTFPENGKFTADQKLIYEIVLNTNLTIFNNSKPGVCYRDLQNLALRTTLEGLLAGGLLRGNVDNMMIAGLGRTFQPHGLGHLLGLDVHDVGGYIQGTECTKFDKSDNNLRLNRVLMKGMVLTIEPGCYFIDTLLDEALADPVLSTFLVPEEIQRFRGFGGVRIEDDVYITDTGCINLTNVPRTVQEVEDWISGIDDHAKYQRKM